MNLTDLQNSVFLKSLGWAIANSLWQSAVVLGLYYIVIASYKNASSKIKNNISTGFLFFIFSWFITTLFNKLINLKNELNRGNEMDNDLVNNYIPAHAEKFSLTNFADSILHALPYLSLAYLLLLWIFLLKFINSYRNTSYIKNNGLLRPGVQWMLFTEKVTSQICGGKKVEIWLSEYVDVPATLGFFKPVILIPVASMNKLTVQQLEAIILHELSHIKRNDYLVNLFISLVETVLFFNPFVVLLIRIIKKERENCCDDLVLQYQYDRHSYASALLFLEQARNQQWSLALASTSGKKQLLSRIKRIMEVDSKTGNLNYGQKLLALLFITGIIGSIAWLSPEKKLNESFTKSRSAAHVISEKLNLSNKSKNIVQNGVYIKIPKFSEFQPKKTTGQNILKKDNNLSNNDKDNHELTTINNYLPFISGRNEEPEFNAGNSYSNREFQSLTLSLDNQNLHQFRFPALPEKSVELNATSQPYFGDEKFFDDVHLDIDIKQLEKRIEDANHSITSLDWGEINEQITSSLKSIHQFPEVAKVMKELNLKKIINDIRLQEIDNNKQLKENFKTLSRLQINNNEQMEEVKRKAVLDKNLFLNKRIFAEDSYRHEENYDKMPLNNSEVIEEFKAIVKRKNSQKPPHTLYNYDFNSTNESNSGKATVEIKNEKPTADKLSLEFKDGVVYINGEKINASSNKKIQAMFKAKKFVIAFDETEPEIQTED